MKRMLSILMALLLLWSLALPAAAAETASTLRLEKTEGTVKVSNASGKSVSITEGMRLYSGYTITTEKNSYAYVSLDSTKAVKLDASSKVEVQKSGKKLELMLISGELFFNVTAPVEKDESLNIRTSTMVTGVRGTSGWVTVTNRFTSSVHLLEGSLTVTSAEPATGQMRQVTITGGQTATAILTGQAQSGSQMTLTVTAVKEEKVPGFVAVEVEKDPVLQKKITALSPLSVPEIIGDAEERLEAEQAAADLAQKEIKKQVESIDVEQAERVEQVFESPAAADDDDDDDDDGGSSEVQSGIVRNLDNPTAAQLNAALREAGVTRVNVTNAGGQSSDLDTDSYVVYSNQILNIQSGTFTVGADKTLVVESGGSLVIDPGTTSVTTLQINGAAMLNGSLTNNGTINVANVMNTKSNVTNNGTINVDGTMRSYGNTSNNGTITITSMTSVHVEEGHLTNTNKGLIQVGTTTQEGLLDISKNGTMDNQGTITLPHTYSQLQNNGTFSNSGSFEIGNDSGIMIGAGEYIENRPGLYAMAQVNNDAGFTYYLGLAKDVPWSNCSNSTVVLVGDESGTLPGGEYTAESVELDLNGRQIALQGTLEITKGSLTISDGEGGGTFTSTAGNAVEVGAGCTVNISGGTIISETGNGVLVKNGGTANISGGTITSTTGNGVQVNDGGTANISGGNINGYSIGVLIDKAVYDTEVVFSGNPVITKTGPSQGEGGYPVYGPTDSFDGTENVASVKLRARTLDRLGVYGVELVNVQDAEGYYWITGPKSTIKPG